MFFALENLCSSSVVECPAPWEFSGVVPAEVKGKEGKKERDKWINTPSTRHQVYSAYEGINASTRISEPKGGEEGNPAFKQHAFVADLDAEISFEELGKGIARLGSFVPNYCERTLSGNIRLIWLFEKPVSFPSTKFAVEFAKYTLAKTKVELVGGGFDRPAWETPNRYYTNSGDWSVINAEARVPYALLQGWIVEVAEKFAWKKERGSISIPLPVVWVELQKKYPEAANQWPGEFVEGAQGPTFWVTGSASPKSAIVKPTGLFTFSSSATKPFFSWADLIGKDFVDRYATEQMGKAVEDIFYDGQSYFRKNGYGDWKAFSKEDIKDHLAVTQGLSTTKQDGAPSEVSRAIQHLQNWQHVDGAAPFVFQPTGLIVRNNLRFLNTHSRRVVPPAPGPASHWGETGSFWFLCRLMDRYFHPKSVPAKPLDYYLTWYWHFYLGGLNLKPSSGLNIITLGPPGVGKTFLNQGVLSYALGGSAEAQDYLMGLTSFNSQLFEVPLWTVDDNSITIDNQSIRKFSAMFKKMAANTRHECHEKFRVPAEVEWLGRVSVTANCDEESARIVPDLSISIRDKLSIFRTADSTIEFPDRQTCERLIREQVPHFHRWLVDVYKPPAHCLGTSRFGVTPYHEESLVRVAEQSSSSAGFAQVLEDFRERFFVGDHPPAFFRASAFQLLRKLNEDQATSYAAGKHLSPDTIGRHLSSLKAKGVEWLTSETTDKGRIWVIKAPAPGESSTCNLPVGANFSKK